MRGVSAASRWENPVLKEVFRYDADHEGAVRRARTEGGVYEFREIPIPTPEPGEVLVAIRAAGTKIAPLFAGG